MNKKIITIFVLTIIALVVLWLYSFGPLAGVRTAKGNPESLKPTSQRSVVGGQNLILNVYHNKDLAENFYTIKFPKSWQLESGSRTGGYNFVFNNGSASSGLQDVPDNTTLELFILSQEEPNLKKILNNYSRLDYQKLSVNNNDIYQLTYQSTENNKTYKTIKTYITGQDHAGVITFSSLQENFPELQPLFLSILNGFQWENK